MELTTTECKSNASPAFRLTSSKGAYQSLVMAASFFKTLQVHQPSKKDEAVLVRLVRSIWFEPSGFFSTVARA
eukprot:2889422-Amphidinium_carterae.1